MRTATALLFGAALLAMAPAQGYEAYKELAPHSAAEMAKLRSEAEKGGVAAILAYAKALEYERSHHQNGVKESDVQGWLRKAAEQGSAEAWFWIGYTATKDELRRGAYIKAASLGFAPAFDDALELTLFRAAEQADPAAAKKLADLARQKNITVYGAAETFATVDACYDAGSADVSKAEREAVEMSDDAGISYTPNDNMKLAEAFANGWGVKKDRKRALALVCHASTVPAELKDMVAHLTGKKGVVAFQEPFLFCDHVTSGENSGFCADRAEEKTETARTDAFTTLTAAWSPLQKTAFAALRKAAEAYFEEHAGSEQDMSGTARNSFFIAEQARLRDAFLADIKAFETGKRPPHADLTAADKALNAAYQNLLKKTDWSRTGTVKPEGIRATQRLWLKYRDAFAAFGKARYPETRAEDWKTHLTRLRTAELKTLAEGS